MFSYFEAARVGSWLGWIFNFSFGSIIFSVLPFGRTFLILIAFSLATASIFVLNQYFDRTEDLENAVKSTLPVASGRLTPSRTLLYFFILVAICLSLVAISNASCLPLFLVYLGLSTAYSMPPIRLKNIPIADFMASGIVAGVLPFVMGSGLSDEVIAQIPTLLLGALPLMFFHCGTHIIQAVGDYEADRKNGVHTFVVRYGPKNGVLVAGIMFLVASVIPVIYSVCGVLSRRHLILLCVLLPLSIPIIRRYMKMVKDPSTLMVLDIQKTTRIYGLVGLTLLWGYGLLARIIGLF